MKKRAILIVGFIITVEILVGAYYIYDQFFSTKTYIENITGIEFPNLTSTEEEFDNGEFVVVAKYTLSESNRKSFIKENHLIEYSKNPIHLAFTNELHQENQPNYLGSDLFVLEDCTKYNSWKILTNLKTGELWVEVLYPDFSGDAPTCNKQN